MKKAILLMLFIGWCHFSYAQENHNKEKKPGFELVISGLIIYAPEQSSSDLASEIHLTYWTSHTWAFGVGYTMVFEEDNRKGHELAALISHKPWSFLTLNAGPSFSLPNTHKDTEISAYLEGEFAFELGNLHTGPTIGTLIGKEFKFFAGWHISYEF